MGKCTAEGSILTLMGLFMRVSFIMDSNGDSVKLLILQTHKYKSMKDK